MQNDVTLTFSLYVTSCDAVAPTGAHSLSIAKDQVITTESAFTKTMADRDHTAFASFCGGDEVFSPASSHCTASRM